ncbi:type I restriction-modification system subunit M [Reichenbachiella ulvae]|uniref:site-specific DNA-methyltransferase (adenine-specific) n=1 Tax=Reichenbachiella ulvae TaxID=2980104 RepID=A0ABT3CV39_9BACT|nr:class I SAM-dependent DNA methyltransferase [Reichenbachiella ulvae]MCV9387497.1 type I restriction-modification system subunit M [Reichenbachiella ulvae]
MAKKAATKKSASAGKNKSMEESLWDSANKLRGSVESSEYKHVVLGLIFLKFVSDKFEERKQELIGEGKEKYLDMKEFYNMKNIFYLPAESRWSYIIDQAKQDDIALKIDTALHTIEKNNPSLKGALPDNYFSRLNMDPSKLAALLDTVNNIQTISEEGEDIVGRIYEYFFGRFAAAEGKGGGEFYTPKSIVNLIAEMLEPYKGKIYDPACGSGGMFVQSIKFVQSHQGNTKDISIYGQEYTATTYKLAKMNLAIRGISANLGEVPADTFFKDQHPELKADYIMANPPFNQSQWREKNELEDDARWAGYTVPPTGNANYAWILHMLSKLSENGTAGFVLANGSMSSNTSGEGEIRKQLIDKDMVDCMIALPGQLFYTTQIPVCLWFITKNKGERPHPENPDIHFRDRKGETLFIDARNMGTMTDRTHKELTPDDIQHIANTYHTWRNKTAEESKNNVIVSDEGARQSPSDRSAYEDIPGYCRTATLTDIQSNDYVLTPGRYVGVAAEEDDGIPFEEKMESLTQQLKEQMSQGEQLDAEIKKNLKLLGYE